MLDVVEVPSIAEIEDAPQSALLAVLEHALQVASSCLAVEHACMGQLGECYEGRLPPRQILLAQLIVDRCTELSNLIGWYRLSCPRSAIRGGSKADELPDSELL